MTTSTLLAVGLILTTAGLITGVVALAMPSGADDPYDAPHREDVEVRPA